MVIKKNDSHHTFQIFFLLNLRKLESWIKLNSCHRFKINLENKSVIDIVRVCSGKPFVLWVPKAIEKVSLSDTQGNEVSIDNIILE